MSTPNISVWGDTFASRYLPISIIREFNFDLNEFNFPYIKEIPYFLQARNGHLVSSYPVGAALTAVPFYLIPVLFGISHQSPWIPILEKFSAASICLLSALFIYLTLRRLSTQRTSLVITAIYSLGTSTFSISSQALWQHGPSQFFLALGLYLLVRGQRDQTSTPWSGFPLGMAVVCRPTDLLMVLPALAIYSSINENSFFRGFCVPCPLSSSCQPTTIFILDPSLILAMVEECSSLLLAIGILLSFMGY